MPENVMRAQYRRRSRRRIARALSLDPADRRHGTSVGWRDGRCRCAACRAWKAADARAYRARVKAREQSAETY